MPIRKTLKQPDFTRLQSVLAQSKDTDNPTYQVLSELIDKIRQMQTNLGQAVQDTVQNGSGFVPSTGGGSTTPSAHHTTHETGGSDPISHLNGEVIDSGTVADARLSANVALKNQDNIFSVGQTVRANSPYIFFNEIDQPANNKFAQIVESGGDVYIQTINDDASNASSMLFKRNGDLRIDRDYYEKGRSFPLGHWIDIPYSAGNFSAPSNQWVVDSGDVLTNHYTLIGKTLIWNFYLINTSITSITGEIYILLPTPYVIAKSFLSSTLTYLDSVKGWGAGFVVCNAGETFIRLRITADATVNWGVVTNGGYQTGHVIIPIL